MLASAAQYFLLIQERFAAEAPRRPYRWLFAEAVDCDALAELEQLGLIERMLGSSHRIAWRLTSSGLAELTTRSAAG